MAQAFDLDTLKKLVRDGDIKAIEPPLKGDPVEHLALTGKGYAFLHKLQIEPNSLMDTRLYELGGNHYIYDAIDFVDCLTNEEIAPEEINQLIDVDMQRVMPKKFRYPAAQMFDADMEREFKSLFANAHIHVLTEKFPGASEYSEDYIVYDEKANREFFGGLGLHLKFEVDHPALKNFPYCQPINEFLTYLSQHANKNYSGREKIDTLISDRHPVHIENLEKVLKQARKFKLPPAPGEDVFTIRDEKFTGKPPKQAHKNQEVNIAILESLRLLDGHSILDNATNQNVQFHTSEITFTVSDWTNYIHINLPMPDGLDTLNFLNRYIPNEKKFRKDGDMYFEPDILWNVLLAAAEEIDKQHPPANPDDGLAHRMHKKLEHVATVENDKLPRPAGEELPGLNPHKLSPALINRALRALRDKPLPERSEDIERSFTIDPIVGLKKMPDLTEGGLLILEWHSNPKPKNLQKFMDCFEEPIFQGSDKQNPYLQIYDAQMFAERLNLLADMSDCLRGIDRKDPKQQSKSLVAEFIKFQAEFDGRPAGSTAAASPQNGKPPTPPAPQAPLEQPSGAPSATPKRVVEKPALQTPGVRFSLPNLSGGNMAEADFVKNVLNSKSQEIQNRKF